MKKVLMIMIAAMLATALSAFAFDKEADIAALRKEMSETTSRRDSIRLLYNIFDLAPRKDYTPILKELYGVASREGDTKTRLDVVRHLANIYKTDSLMNLLQKHVSDLPPSKDQKETLLFLKMRQVSQNERYGKEYDSNANIARIMASPDTAKMDSYERVLRVFTICQYLASHAQGPLLLEYMDRLEDELKNANLENTVLKNLYLAEASNIYTAVGENKRALETDRKLLDLIDDMEKAYKAEGRKYRNYDVSRYIIYRRMLSNYQSLSLEETNAIYDKILQLATVSKDVSDDLEKNKRAAAYHAMKNKRYGEALMYLKRALPAENSEPRKRHLLEMMVEAASATGDVMTAENARKDLDKLNEKLSSEEARQKYNELQVRYQVSELIAENAELELENKNEQIENSRRSIILVSVLWIVFAIVIVVSLYHWTRYRRMMSGLHSFVNAVGDERDTLKKRRYYDYDRSSYSDVGGEDEYNKVPVNNHDSVSMLNKMLNDIFFISSISMDDTRKYRQNVSVKGLMEECIATVTANLHRNVNVNVSYPDPDFDIRVDRECLQKLIDQILVKASYLAPECGSIGLSCTLSEQAKMARFVFKHSGSGLPHGNEERIFENFFRFGDIGDGEDGENVLFVCRMITFLSRCSLKSSSGRANVSGGQLVLMVPLD